MTRYWLPWLVGMPAETSLAICSLIFGGVLERLPALRIAFAHGGGAFPATIGRIEHGFDVRPDLCAVANDVSPREYLERIYLDSLVHDPLALRYLVDLMGPDRIALGSDYPFPLGEARPGALIDSCGFPEETRARLLHGTALEWLGLSPARFGRRPDAAHDGAVPARSRFRGRPGPRRSARALPGRIPRPAGARTAKTRSISPAIRWGFCPGERRNTSTRSWRSGAGSPSRRTSPGENPWMPYHEFLAEPMARLVGASATEVVTMNSLTVNLHLMMTSFYRPTRERNRILLEAHAFPSDDYAVESQAVLHGFDPAAALVRLQPDARGGKTTIDTADVARVLEREGDSIALVLLPGVQYYTGQAFEIEAITKLAHAKGCVVGFDLAHAAGNLVLRLHDWNVDFAVWCTYKYLNSGPGSVGGCFVHERHASPQDRPRLAGWWGHDKKSRFRMEPGFRPIPGAEGWQLSNPPILSLAAIRASLAVFTEAGGMEPLREKSLRLTAYLEWLLAAGARRCDRDPHPGRPAATGMPAFAPREIELLGKGRLRKARGLRRHRRLARAGRDPGGARPAVQPVRRGPPLRRDSSALALAPRDTESPRHEHPGNRGPIPASGIGPGSRDGAARPRRHRRLLDGRRGHQRHPVHDPAPRARHRSERAVRIPLRGAAGRAGGPGLRGAGLGHAARRRQLRVREPRARSLPRLRRLVLAVVLAVRGDRRGLLPHRAVPARHRRGRGLRRRWRPRSRPDRSGWRSRSRSSGRPCS